ncbi:Cysteine-rich repeat secretory protein 38 [Striga hermonthica]|uniref:Cysteine-rich repeat secretory protein 38 n=1 Tax=Striga hermonthica TaxID=68872 RepID=A0A9N7NVR2_STRHE|nr:Cysteine-rich repeat secretory protein 38 [Striga hermonthica]
MSYYYLISLLTILSSFLFQTSFSTEPYLTYICTGSNYTENSQFGKDLNCLMQDLNKVNGTDNGGFRNASSGQAYGLAQCRGDVKPDDCHACINTTTSDLTKTQCPGRRRGISCGTAEKLLRDLAKKAPVARKPNMFAECTAELPEKESGNRTLYGMAQCSMDLSPKKCTSCLNQAVSTLSACCTRNIGGRVYYGSCIMRYEIYPFLGK